MSPERSALAQTFQLSSRIDACGPRLSAAPNCAVEPSGSCTCKRPTARRSSTRKTARAAAGADGGSDEGAVRVEV